MPITLAQWQEALLTMVQGGTAPETFTKHCVPQELLESRLGAYRNTYQLTLQDWLAKAYPQIKLLVGPEYFLNMANNFSQQCPITHDNFAAYGAQFPDFIESDLAQTQALERLPYLPDVARTDWLMHQSYYAASAQFDHNAFTQLSSEDHEKLIFTLAPHCAMLNSQWPLVDIWRVNTEGASITQLTATKARKPFLISRQQYHPSIRALGEREANFLKALLRKETFLRLAESYGESIGLWIEKGWITGFEVDHAI